MQQNDLDIDLAIILFLAAQKGEPKPDPTIIVGDRSSQEVYDDWKRLRDEEALRRAGWKPPKKKPADDTKPKAMPAPAGGAPVFTSRMTPIPTTGIPTPMPALWIGNAALVTRPIAPKTPNQGPANDRSYAPAVA